MPLVEKTIASLRQQTLPPAKVVVVDSGSDPTELAILEDISDLVIDISDRDFNYSFAINVAIPKCHTDFVLVISSHVCLLDSSLAARAADTLYRHAAAALYCYEDEAVTWQEIRISKINFNSMNGLYNSCAFIKHDLLVQRNFREDVFSCEDQEWAKWLFSCAEHVIIRVPTRLIEYKNPRGHVLKWLNEEVALAYFVDSSRMSIFAISSWVMRGVVSFFSGKQLDGKLKWILAFRLLTARFKKPYRSSRYF